jgi:hypothetical protein
VGVKTYTSTEYHRPIGAARSGQKQGTPKPGVWAAFILVPPVESYLGYFEKFNKKLSRNEERVEEEEEDDVGLELQLGLFFFFFFPPNVWGLELTQTGAVKNKMCSSILSKMPSASSDLGPAMTLPSVMR